jgi:hypothetical protein
MSVGRRYILVQDKETREKSIAKAICDSFLRR